MSNHPATEEKQKLFLVLKYGSYARAFTLWCNGGIGSLPCDYKQLDEYFAPLWKKRYPDETNDDE